ncbi:VUT family protein [Arcanobacterium bovis]|uniref:Probable queuosine precursor transporter n=2 Tax=Arcanobacterium bovis TaxID=2529275 RepID=A0A4Q9UZE4_9ACTO|nr:queuosine precursor transporter [Arcanobacterium bovis]TBW21113.1 VUT family protein [Arcanobacterium bovis]
MFDIFAVCFVAFLLLSNIGATKLIEAGPLIFDGGAILFPLTYVIGDVLSEVYGFRLARRAIVMGFVLSIVASVVFWLIILAPPAADYQDQQAFQTVLGVVPRFVIASLAGYLVGQLLNSWVLVKIKARSGENNLWFRLIGSTVVGEFADTAIFCVIAWIGVMDWGVILNLMFVGYIYKVGVEVVLLPVTYTVVGWVKRHEITYHGTPDALDTQAADTQTAGTHAATGARGDVTSSANESSMAIQH